ncbi:MAG: hypothetical protein C0502_11560 [Opitutus sp.]|nr:hypothetical protein [Opitutus sp.]
MQFWPRLCRALVLVCMGLVGVTGAQASRMTTGLVIDRMTLLRMTDRVMESGAVVPVLFSADRYAVVRRGWIAGFLNRFRDDLSRKNVPVSLPQGDSGWRTGFNCTAFTDLFLGNAAAEMMVDQWHSDAQADRPAIVAVWYTPDTAPIDPRTKRRQAHSVVLILTDAGPVFVDPQSGVVNLTRTELLTVTHRRA